MVKRRYEEGKMKKLTIQFDGFGVYADTEFIGFNKTSLLEMAVTEGGFWDRYGDFYHFLSGDILFNYETGTRWKVVEAK